MARAGRSGLARRTDKLEDLGAALQILSFAAAETLKRAPHLQHPHLTLDAIRAGLEHGGQAGLLAVRSSLSSAPPPPASLFALPRSSGLFRWPRACSPYHMPSTLAVDAPPPLFHALAPPNMGIRTQCEAFSMSVITAQCRRCSTRPVLASWQNHHAASNPTYPPCCQPCFSGLVLWHSLCFGPA